MQFAYWIVFVRLLFWWRATGRAWADSLDERLRAVVRWHAVPIACWMALPRHIGPFLWYVSPANGGMEQTSSLLSGLREYSSAAVAEYHVSLTCALAAGSLAAVGLLATGRLKRGGAAVVLLVVLAAFLTMKHPNRQSRFLTTWIGAGWILAGAGAAALVYGGWTARLQSWRPAIAGAVLAGLGVVHGLGNWSTSVPLTGPHPELASLREVVDDYLPELDGDQRVTILATVEIRPMHQWSFLERFGQLRRLDDRFFGFGEPGEANRAGFRSWLGTTDCTTIVLLESLLGPDVRTLWDLPHPPQQAADYHEVLAEQKAFRLVRQRDFPRHGCAVQVWKRQTEMARK
jgi:hypothetical protein